jgi:flagellar biosynthesis protein FlhG
VRFEEDVTPFRTGSAQSPGPPTAPGAGPSASTPRISPAVASPAAPPVPIPLVQTAPIAASPSSGAVQARRARARTWRILAVGGGKGGIGKSLIAANLGIEMAQRGFRVVLIDADLGGANLHTCLGVELPRVTLSDFISRKVTTIEEVAVPTGVQNLWLVSGALDSLDVANPHYAQKLKLLRNFQTLDVDYAILDLGAGTSFNVLDFFLIADHGILVLVPEPTSIENGYRFIKAAFFRRLSNVQAVYGIEPLVQEAMSHRQEYGIKTPFDVIAAVKKRDPEAGESLEREMLRFRPRLIVNQTRTAADRQVGDAVVAAWRKYFGLEMDYVGAIGYDDDVWKAVRKRRPVLLEHPQSETAKALSQIAERFLCLDQPPP